MLIEFCEKSLETKLKSNLRQSMFEKYSKWTSSDKGTDFDRSVYLHWFEAYLS